MKQYLSNTIKLSLVVGLLFFGLAVSSKAEEKTYTIDVETRPSTETYSSFIMYVGEQGAPAYDTPVVVKAIYVDGKEAASEIQLT